MTKIKSKYLLSLLLSLAMAFSLIVTPAFAAGVVVVEDDTTYSDGTEAAVEEIGATDDAEAVTASTTVVAQIGTTGYDTLAGAINEAVSGDTVTLLSDVTLSDTLNIYKNITLDLGDYTIKSTASGKAVYTTQTLTIKAENGGIESSGGYAVLNQKGSGAGTLTISGGTYTSSADHAIYNLAGTVIIESGTISSTYSEKAGIYNTSGGTLTVKGGCASGVKYGIYSSGTVNITAGTVTGTAASSSYGVYLASGATATISGGEIKGYEGLRQASTASTVSEDDETTADVVISDGTFEGVTHAVNVSTTATISGGTFTATGTKEQYAVALYSTGATVIVSGGTFTGMYSTAWVYSGSGGSIKVADGCFVNEGTLTDSNSGDTALVRTVALAVAQIGSTCYASLADAFSSVSSGETATITLLCDTTTTSRIVVNGEKTITLDLGGKTLTGYGFNVLNGNLTVQNGTISDVSQPLNVYGGTDSTLSNYSVLTVEEDVTISGADWGICLFPDSSSSMLGYGAVINMYGTIINEEDSCGIFVSGNLGNSSETASAMAASSNASVVNIYGTITTGNQAVAMNGYAIVNVYDDAEITGSEAIGVKRGVLNVYGGTLTATGSYVDPATANYSGTESTGGAISVTSTYNYAGTIEVNITGGTIISTNGNALYIGHSGTSDTTTAYTTGIKVSITGGDFSTSGTDVDAVYVAEAEDDDDDSYTQSIISGGTYSTEVAAEYCADGYAPTSTTTTDADGNKVTTYGVTLFYLGVSNESSISVSASIASGYSTSTLYVKVSADNISSYNTSAYPTTSLTYTPDSTVDSGSYIFAGWYTLDGDGSYTAMNVFPKSVEDTTEATVYYAKFVDKNALKVYCYYTPKGATSSGPANNAWRFISSLESGNPQALLFKIGDTVSKVRTFYTSSSVGVTKTTYKPADFSSASQYVASYSVLDSTDSLTLYTVQSGWLTLDGTEVYGSAYIFDASGCTGATALSGTEQQ